MQSSISERRIGSVNMYVCMYVAPSRVSQRLDDIPRFVRRGVASEHRERARLSGLVLGLDGYTTSWRLDTSPKIVRAA